MRWINQKPIFRAIFLLCTILSTLIAQANTPTPGTLKGAVEFSIPEWFKQSFLEIQEDATEAAEQGRHVLLFFHLDNCPYCAQLLDENFNSGDNSAYIQSHFDVIDINIKGDREVAFDAQTSLSEKQLSEHLQVLYTPTVLFIDGNNQVVLRLDGYRNTQRFRSALEFVHNKDYQHTTFSAYSAEQQKEKRYTFRAHPAFSTTDDFQRAAEQPLAIIIEDAYCEDCDALHDTLFSRDDVSAALQQLTVVRVDAQSEQRIIDPQGQRRSMREWVASLNLSYRPSVLLYDRGARVATIDSRLYSWHFIGFISWVAGRHTQDYPDVYAYIAQLRKARLAAGEDVSYVD